MVIVDSDVWSEAFRKNGKKSKEVIRLQELIEDDEVLAPPMQTQVHPIFGFFDVINAMTLRSCSSRI